MSHLTMQCLYYFVFHCVCIISMGNLLTFEFLFFCKYHFTLFKIFFSFFSHNSSLQQFYKGWFKDYFQKILTSLLPINVIFPIHFWAACFLIYEVFILKLVCLRNLANFIKFSLSLLLQSPSCDIAPVEDKTATHQLPSRIRSPSSPLNHHWPLKGEAALFSLTWVGVWASNWPPLIPSWQGRLPCYLSCNIHWHHGWCYGAESGPSPDYWLPLNMPVRKEKSVTYSHQSTEVQASFFIYICTVLVGTGPQDYSVLFGRHKIVFVHVSYLPS